MDGLDEATENWRVPVTLGIVTAAALWAVWFSTKVPCTIENAREGLCNAGSIARFINHQIMAQCLGLGFASATLKGGYDVIMLNRERRRADEAEARAEQERRRVEEERQRVDALLEEVRQEQREERQEQREERQEQREERQRNAATQQALLETMAQINQTLVRLLERQENGTSARES